MKLLIGVCIMFGFFKTHASELVKTALSELKSGQAVIIDVREEDEVESAHIVGAKWIPLSLINSDVEKVTKSIKENFSDKKIYFYCRSGNRSGQATKILKNKGIEGINLGGIDSLERIFGTEPGKIDCCS